MHSRAKSKTKSAERHTTIKLNKPMKFSLEKLGGNVSSKDDYFDYYPNGGLHQSSALSSVKNNKGGNNSTVQLNRFETDQFALNEYDMKMLEELERKRKRKTARGTSNIIMN